MSKSKRQRARWPRRVAWLLVALLVVTVMMVLGLEVAVRQPGVQRAVKNRLVDIVAERTGLALEIDDLRMSLLKGLVEIDGLAVSSPGEVAILATEHMELAWRLSSLWDSPFTLKRLIIAEPEFDLGAPMPALPAKSEQGESGFALAIEHFELVEGRIDGPVLPLELRTWIEEWWMEDLRLEGWYGPQEVDLDLKSQLHWRRSDGRPVQVSVDGKLQGPQQGPWDVTRLSLLGEGLEAEMTATVGSAAIEPVIATLSFQAEPHLLIPVPPSEAPITVSGRFDTGEKTGDLQLSARGVPIELASPWLAMEARDSALFSGWSFDVDADLVLGGEISGLRGESQWRLAHSENTWATAEIEILPAATPDRVAATISGLLLPDRPGQRSIRALVEAPTWAEIAELTLSDGEIEVVGADLASLREDVASIWPGPLPDAVSRGMVGVLEAKAEVAGPVRDLQLDLEASWRHGETANAVLMAAVSAERVILESFSGKIGEHRFDGTAQFDLPVPIERAQARLELKPFLPEVPRVALAVTLEGGVATVEAQADTPNGVTSTLTVGVPLASLEDLPELGDVLAALPIVRDDGPLRLEWQVPEAEWADWVSQLSEELPLSRLRMGSRGSLLFDLARPLAGSGQMVVEGLEIDSQELTVTAESSIRIRLEGGQLIFEAARLGTEGGVLEVEAWTELATDWQPGDSLAGLLQHFRIDANGAAPVALLQNFVDGIYTDGDLQVAMSVFGSPEELNGEIRIHGPQARFRIGDPEGVLVSNPTLEMVVEENRIRLEKARLEIDEGEIVVTGQIPIPTLLGLWDAESRDPDRSLEPMTLRWEMPQADWADTLSKLGVEEPPESLVMAGRGEITLDPRRPLEAEGGFEISRLSLITEGHEVRNEGPLRADFAGGRLDLTSLKLLADGQPFVLAGFLELDQEWTSEQSVLSLVESLAIQGRGTLAAVLLNPFLAGGSAEGLLQVDLEVAGTLEEPTGRLRLQGPEASILFVSPYVAKIEAPELDLELIDGRAWVRDGRVRLNDGDVELQGSLGLDGVDLLAAFDGLRFRLDHGLLVRAFGELHLDLDAQGHGRLTGEVIVDQGSLTRPISLDRDFITDLLSPIDLTGTEASPLEQIDLDLRLETRRGVRVRNNVADLAVRWDAVRVRGNLLQPVVDGRFIVEPGGRAFLFGQTFRIDRGVLTFPGQPGAEAVLDLETTSSLDDPLISRLEGEDVLALGSPEPAEDLESRAAQAGWSAAAFVGEQVATRINEAVPGARFTFRPILIFGEADPGARLTVGRDFSRYVTLAASIDLRNAERQTYLMDAHDLPGLPGLVLQVFTNDQEQEGVTLQHRLRFGRHRRTAPTGPTVRRIKIDQVPDVSRRALKRSVGLSKGDRASADDLFLAEVEVGEFLRRAGYPDARIDIEAREVAERKEKVDLEVSIDPGPLALFQFEGETLSRALQRSITPLYRTDFYESVALQEMQAQTVRALRSLGFQRPNVEIEVDQSTSSDVRDVRSVTISMEGGDRIALQALEIEGLPEAEAELVAAGFSTRVQRVELAVGEPSADARLLAAIRGLGYPKPEIMGRSLSAAGDQLTVQIQAGPQRHLDAVIVQGVEGFGAEDWVRISGVGVGDVARRDRIASGAMAIEAEFQSNGYTNVRVRPRLDVGSTDGEGPVELVYEVEPGLAFTVADSRISGLKSTSRRWATNVAEMESGAPLRENEVAAARSRLYETGLFTMVGSESFETDGGRTEVVFDVEERPRYSVAYGFRWDSDQQTQGVVDVIDRNFLGRNVTLGLRALYAQDDWNIRLGAGVPRLFGSRAVLEVFGSYKDFSDEIEDELFLTRFDEQTVEASIQVAYPFGNRISGRLYGRYRTVDLLVTDIDKDPEFPFPPFELEFLFRTPLVGTLWIYDTRGRELVLARGSFASLDLSGTGDFLDSDFEYIRMFGQFNVYRPVARWAGRGLSWAQSLRLGLADSFDQELDRNDRFFAGGQYSVRGYPTDSLGPVEVLGDDLVRPLGGKTLVVINEELRFDLMGPVAGLVFFDLGNVWEDTAEFSSSLFKSVGLGLRAVTPIGLLRLDWAFPLDRRELDPTSKVYFGFGNTF